MRSATRRRSVPLLLLAALLTSVFAACGETTTSKPQPAPAVGPLDGFGAPTLGTTSYPVPSGAKFVATNGNDAAAGSSSAPWRTLEHAVAAAPNGATVVLREGTYREGVEVPATKRLTIQSASGEEVWLSGSDVVNGWVQQDARSWRRPGWTVDLFATNINSTLVNDDHPLAADPDQLFLDGRPLTQVGSRSALGPGTFLVDGAADTLWLGENPAGHTLEASVRGDGLTVKSAGSVVRGIGFRHYGTPIQRLGAVKAQANDITFEDALFADNAGAGVSVAGDDVRIVNSTAIANGRLGIHADSANRLLVENTLLRRNNVERFSAIAASGGIKITDSDGITLRHNLAEENLAHGLWLDQGSDRSTLVHNITVENLRGGILLEMSVGGIVASNSIVENEQGLIIGETSGVQAWNNAILENDISVEVLDGRREPLPVDIALRNNVISTSVASSRPVVIIDDVNRQRSGATMRVSLDRNSYYRKSTSFTPYLMSWGNYPSGKLVLRSLADVQSRTGQDRTSKVLDNATVDPNVDDAEAGRYGVPAGSALSRAGLPLPAAVASAVGVTAGVPVPVGILPESTLTSS